MSNAIVYPLGHQKSVIYYPKFQKSLEYEEYFRDSMWRLLLNELYESIKLDPEGL